MTHSSDRAPAMSYLIHLRTARPSNDSDGFERVLIPVISGKAIRFLRLVYSVEIHLCVEVFGNEAFRFQNHGLRQPVNFKSSLQRACRCSSKVDRTNFCRLFSSREYERFHPELSRSRSASQECSAVNNRSTATTDQSGPTRKGPPCNHHPGAVGKGRTAWRVAPASLTRNRRQGSA